MLGLSVHLLPMLGKRWQVSSPEAAEIASEWLLAGVGVPVTD